MKPVLFYGVPMGCSFGSIVALEWLGQPYQLCRIEMLEGAWRHDFAQINPKLRTPALRVSSNVVLTESMAILGHLAAQGLNKGLGFPQGRAEFDKLNEMLAYLNTDFFFAFGPLWMIYEDPSLSESEKQLLTRIGSDDVRKQCEYLDTLLLGRNWLVGDRLTVADAYLSGVGRWLDYLRPVDLAKNFPNLSAYLERLRLDPAVKFAEAVEAGEAVRSNSFHGHVTMESLLPGAAII